MILYFTGTGNSKYVANRIAKETKDELFDLNTYIKANTLLNVRDNQRIIVVCPTYAWRIPNILNDYLNKLSYLNNQIYFVMTCGDSIGAANKCNKNFADKNRLIYMGTALIEMPENYIAMFNSPNIEEAISIINKANKKIDILIDYLKNNQPFKETKNNLINSFLSGIVNKSFYLLFVNDKKYYVKDNYCIGCGKCVIVCPLNNITLKNGKPVWHHNCTQCMACISYCPKEAIEYGDSSKGKNRYTIESTGL